MKTENGSSGAVKIKVLFQTLISQTGTFWLMSIIKKKLPGQYICWSLVKMYLISMYLLSGSLFISFICTNINETGTIYLYKWIKSVMDTSVNKFYWWQTKVLNPFVLTDTSKEQSREHESDFWNISVSFSSEM